MKIKRYYTFFISFFIPVLIIAGSFCPGFLASRVEAASNQETSGANHKEQREMEHGMDHASSADESASSRETSSCCFNADHHPASMFASGDFDQIFIIESASFAVIEESLMNLTDQVNTSVFLPPPQTAALRSIVKNE